MDRNPLFFSRTLPLAVYVYFAVSLLGTNIWSLIMKCYRSIISQSPTKYSFVTTWISAMQRTGSQDKLTWWLCGWWLVAKYWWQGSSGWYGGRRGTRRWTSTIPSSWQSGGAKISRAWCFYLSSDCQSVRVKQMDKMSILYFYFLIFFLQIPFYLWLASGSRNAV